MATKPMSLALQGGGSHGAFTWGVLDRLLEEERLEIEGVSGASAGAMNAVVLAHGLAAGGREGARQALARFWEGMASKGSFAVMPDDLSTPVQIDSEATPTPAFKAFLSLSRFFSPYQLNPFDLNPLRSILVEQIDFERLQSESRPKIFVAATRVRTGTLKLFRNQQLSVDALLASACIPSIHKAIEIDGEPYWDGGLAANPPIFPLLHYCACTDIAVVMLHPWYRDETPTTADEIWHRLNEISFSSSFHTELQGLAIAKREAERSLLAFGRLERRLRRLNMHVIEAQDVMAQLSALSKLNTHPSFLAALRDEGRARASLWLAENFDLVGSRSSFSLARFLPR